MGADAEEAFGILVILLRWVNKLPGAVFGTASAAQLKTLIGKAGARAGAAGTESFECACGFAALLVKRNLLRHSASVISEIRKLLDSGNGIVHATLESASSVFVPEDELTSIIRERTGANEVRLEKKIRPELVGGYRLRIGDKIIDASVLARLKQIENEMKNAVIETVNREKGEMNG